MPLGPALKRLRTGRLLSQRELASRVGASVACIAYLETGRRLPSLGMLARLVRELRPCPQDLLGLLLAALDGGAATDSLSSPEGSTPAAILPLADGAR